MKSSNVLFALVLAGAVGAGGYWLGARHPAGQRHRDARRRRPRRRRAPPPPRRASCCTTATPWGWPTPRPRRRRIPWAWTTSRSTKAKTRTAAARPSGNQIRISTDKIQKLGVRIETAGMRALGRTVRAAGRVEPDERHIYSISPKFEGYVERLHVNVTGQPVAKGQPLFEVYSPELVSAQREYIIARQGVQAMGNAGERGPGRHEATGRFQPGAAAQLGPVVRADRGAGQDRRGQAHHHVPLAGRRASSRKRRRCRACASCPANRCTR